MIYLLRKYDVATLRVAMMHVERDEISILAAWVKYPMLICNFFASLSRRTPCISSRRMPCISSIPKELHIIKPQLIHAARDEIPILTPWVKYPMLIYNFFRISITAHAVYIIKAYALYIINSEGIAYHQAAIDTRCA